MSAADPKVFISYRREETAGHAGRLYDAIASRFGDGNVFMDVDMAPGVDFVNRITDVVSSCHVLLVIMGPRWATISDGAGGPRIGEPDDFVRLEVQTALKRSDVTVIPVLVAGAQMPDAAALPDGLQALARRNALELSDTRWRTDVQRLVDALGDLLPGTSAAAPLPPPPPPARREPAGLALQCALVAGLAGIAGRGVAEIARPDAVQGKPARIADVVVWRGVTWLVIGSAVALFLSIRVRGGPGRVVTGAAVGALAGAGGAAIFAVPRYLPAAKPPDDVLDLLSIAEFAFTGALVGALVGAISSRRAGAGLGAGLLAGALIELLVIAAGWEVDSVTERVVKVGLDAFVIVGLTVAALQLASARRSGLPGRADLEHSRAWET